MISMNFNDMIAAIKPPTDGSDDPEIPNGSGGKGRRKHLMLLLNGYIQRPPRFERLGETEVIGVPSYALLDPYMNTTAGATAFLNPKVNGQFKNMLNIWSRPLVAPDSHSVLTEDEKGWLSSDANAQLEQVAQGRFLGTFICDPSKPHWGFESWDDFFTRSLREDVPRPPRPAYWPRDNSRINSACESTVYRIAKNVNEKDYLWSEGQLYSLQHMLDNNPLSSQFTEGTIFQAFLSPFNYHR
ncbi:hypothetical protein ONZ45_g10387 [Pleurotus djamor]|nr:hypothetical protein ONZ45_g10387 [Pleurotus djamor]